MVFIFPIETNKTYIQIRDLGHALSLSIEEENEFIYVKYKIPKPFGRKYVEHIRGFKYYDDTFNYAVGEFRLKKNRKTGKEIIAFLNDMPTENIISTNLTDYEGDFWIENNPIMNILNFIYNSKVKNTETNL